MFVGANAVWCTPVLQRLRFTEGMIAEDDDVSMRAIRAGLDIHVCPRAEVTELAPANALAFFSQRLRWTFGYEQSLNRHLCGLAYDRPRALVMRLFSWYCYTLTLLGSGQAVAGALLPHDELFYRSALPYVLYALPSTTIAAGVLMMLRHNKWRNACSILSWLFVAIAYGGFQLIITLYARVRMLCPFEWKVTQRRVPVHCVPAAAPRKA